MKPLLKALLTLYNATPGGDAIRTATPGGLWTNIAPKGTAYPFIGITFPTGSHLQTFLLTNDRPILTFTVWDKKTATTRGPTRAWGVRDIMKAWLHDQLNGTVLDDGSKVVYSKSKGNGQMVEDPESETFGIHVDYEFLFG